MAKLLVAALFLAMVVCSQAGQRKLQQGLFNCGGIKQLGKSATDNRCCVACWCVGDQSDKKQFAGDAIQKMCKTECGKCVAAGNDPKQCPSDSSDLPKVCSNGLQFSNSIRSLVDKCIDLYRKDAAKLTKASGC